MKNRLIEKISGKQEIAKLNLLCFPYAGAGASVYYRWKEYFGNKVMIYAIQLPGRENIIVGDAQEDRRIVTVAVPKQAEVATEDTSQEIANIKNKEEELTKEVNKELLSEWVHAANKVVLSDIFLALYGKGVFTDSNRLYTYEEIVKTLNIPNKLYKLMHRWLTVLCNEKIVVHRDGGYCVNLFIAEQYKNNKKLWDEMYSIEGRLHYSQKLLDYLKTSSDVLPELMAGKEDPLNLLFPKGEMDVAMAAYHDNIINRIMNGLAKEEIEFLALDNRRTPIRILEVGAGVGGSRSFRLYRGNWKKNSRAFTEKL